MGRQSGPQKVRKGGRYAPFFSRAQKTIGAVFVAFALSAGWTAPVFSADLPTLLPADGGTYKPRSDISISMPDSIGGIDMASIRVEIDNIDVTDLLKSDTGRLVYRPANPLAAGAHTVIVVGRTSKGQLVELASWTITITGGAAPDAGDTNVALQSNNSIDALLLLSDQNIEQGRDRFGVHGAGDARLKVTSGRWALSSAANYFLDSKRRFTATDEVFDIGEHATSLDYSGDGWNAGLVAGQHDPGYDNFLMSGFSRRGFSLHGGSANGRVQAKAFSTASETLVGTDDTFGINESSGHVTGAGVTMRPFDLGKNDLSVTALVYDGEQGNNTSSASGVTNATGDSGEGNGWGTSINSAWLDRRLQIGGELARTDFDADGVGGAAS